MNENETTPETPKVEEVETSAASPRAADTAAGAADTAAGRTHSSVRSLRQLPIAVLAWAVVVATGAPNSGEGTRLPPRSKQHSSHQGIAEVRADGRMARMGPSGSRYSSHFYPPG